MAYSVVVGDTIENTIVERNGTNPRIQFSRRVERVPVAKNAYEALMEDEAYFYMIQTLPSMFRGLRLTSTVGRPNGLDGWIYDITYTRRQLPRIGFLDYSGSSVGGTIKRTHSLKTVWASGRPGVAIPNNNNGINWNGQVFEGIEVPSPTYEWSETWGHVLNVMSNPYIAMCRSMTASVNTIPFRGFEPGEVLFKGISDNVEIAESDDGDYTPIWKITYNFAVSPNVPHIRIGDLEPFEKRGHHYLHVVYTKSKSDPIDGSSQTEQSKKIIGKPEFAYVEQVFPEIDFSVLGIGIGNISELILGVSI
ncbi:MAG: hypothetical protein FWD31_10090 [Planctomycetaceae bacterium]|nr:hypothetical protein [Planctomycetaceae bacterium]